MKNDVQVVHVAMSAVGASEARQLSFSVKTLMLHTRQPVHLHIFVDSVARNILTNLFGSWQLLAGKCL